MTSSGQKIGPLTSIRFFAAFLVVLFHFSKEIDYPLGLKQISGLGPPGVEFFFILSGFILTMTYKKKFSDSIGAGDLRSFYMARIARVYPVHLLILLLITPISLLLLVRLDSADLSHKLSLFMSWIASALLVNIYIPTQTYENAWNAPSWSIACEAIFYILAPFIIYRVIKSAKPYRLFVACLLVSVVLQITGLYFVREHVRTIQGDLNLSIDFLIYRMPIFRIFDFALGCILFNIAESQKPRLHPNVAILIAFLAILFFMMIRSLEFSKGDTFLAAVIYTGELGFFFSIPFSIIIIIAYSTKSVLSRVLNAPILILLGEASYSLYLLHWLFIKLLLVLHTFGIARSNALGWTGIILCLGASILVFRYFEEPARKFMRARLINAGHAKSSEIQLPS